jgi:hypothetical protein
MKIMQKLDYLNFIYLLDFLVSIIFFSNEYFSIIIYKKFKIILFFSTKTKSARILNIIVRSEKYF